MQQQFSNTYMKIIDLLFETEMKTQRVYVTKNEDKTYEKTKTDFTTRRPHGNITITDTDLYNKCTSAEWHIVGRICSELKDCNALWLCPEQIKKSSSNRIAIKGLIDKKILIKTETTDIYLVNPIHIRRGEFSAVLATTATLLKNSIKVLPEHIVNKKPVNSLVYNNQR